MFLSESEGLRFWSTNFLEQEKREMDVPTQPQLANLPIIPLFVLFRPSGDWDNAYLHWLECFCLCNLPIEVVISSGNILKDISGRNVLAGIWACLSPV